MDTNYDIKKCIKNFKDFLNQFDTKTLVNNTDSSPVLINNLKYGKSKPKLEFVLKLANSYNMSISELLLNDTVKAQGYDIDFAFKNLYRLLSETKDTTSDPHIPDELTIPYRTYRDILARTPDNFQKSFTLENYLKLCIFHDWDMETALRNKIEVSENKKRKKYRSSKQ